MPVPSGNDPVGAAPVRLAAPDIQAGDLERALRCIQSGNLVQGPQVAEFEQKIAGYTGLPHCAVVSSGTAALHLALLALQVPAGASVIVPAFTYPATANVVEIIGARTVLCDVEPGSYVLSARTLQQAFDGCPQGSVAAVMPVHEFGYPVQIAEIARICRERGARVIEDAACAFGTQADGGHPGLHGDLACLSFHPRKAVTTGEGGAVLARDAALMERVRDLRNHGMRVNGISREFVLAGLNYRMTDFQAALGIGQIGRFARELDDRRALAAVYCRELAGQSQLELPQLPPGHALQTFMVVLADAIDRDAVASGMREHGIECGPAAQALNCLQYFRERYGLRPEHFPVATRLYRQGLALPMHGRVSPQDVSRVCARLHDVLASSGVRARPAPAG